MVHLSLFTFILFIGLSMVIARNDVKFRNTHQNRFSQNNEHTRSLRNLMGKLVDTEANTIYNVDGQKQHGTPLDSDATSTKTPLAAISLPKQEEIACVSACHSCLEAYSIVTRMKKDEDNCGPMCDCADSCFLMPIEEVAEIYAPFSSVRNGKNCWWRSYTEILNNARSSSK